MTYQYGDTGEYAYGKRAHATGWHLAPHPPSDTRGHFLVVSDEGAAFAFRATRWAPTARRTRRPFVIPDEDALRRETVRNASRWRPRSVELVPRRRCYCDKIWNNLNAVAPGSETFRLPYARPMDHIYDLPRFRDDMLRFVNRVSATRACRRRRARDGSGRRRPRDDPRRGLLAGTTASEHAGETVVRLPRGFTAEDARTALRSLADTRVIEVDYLGGEGTFCGFGPKENPDFDARVGSGARAGQYYRMTELWEDMGAPRSGRGDDVRTAGGKTTLRTWKRISSAWDACIRDAWSTSTRESGLLMRMGIRSPRAPRRRERSERAQKRHNEGERLRNAGTLEHRTSRRRRLPIAP